MTFYFKPPRGNIALHRVHKCVSQRFKYIMSLLNKEEEPYLPENFEFLFTGCAMDRAGHYMLRLLSLSSPHLKHFVVQAETNLFSTRLELLRPIQIFSCLKVAYRHIHERLTFLKCSEKYGEILVNIKNICQSMASQHVIDHAFASDHSSECEQYTIHAPFTMCLSLVRQRKVSLKNGMAEISCGFWKYLLTELFEMHVTLGMEQLINSECFYEAFQDPRMKELRVTLEAKLRSGSKCSSATVFTAQEVDTAASVHFPLCMSHLHRVLRSRHRLSHGARRHYSLFLKDIGMPVEEAIKFWSNEYSQPRKESCGGCCHSWQKDARRYYYSIRHMYGLEGGRYNYKGPRCSAIQASCLQPSSESGCPFKNFDEDKLIAYFSPNVVNDIAVLKYILNLKNSSPNMACRTYLLTVGNTHLNQDCEKQSETTALVNFISPAQYYFLCKGV